MSSSVFGGNDHNRDSPVRRGTGHDLWADRRIDGGIDLRETNENVRAICFSVRTRILEYALDAIHRVGEIASAFHGGKRGRDQHHQEGDDADDDE
jgi:hypothetical protein